MKNTKKDSKKEAHAKHQNLSEEEKRKKQKTKKGPRKIPKFY